MCELHRAHAFIRVASEKSGLEGDVFTRYLHAEQRALQSQRAIFS